MFLMEKGENYYKEIILLKFKDFMHPIRYICVSATDQKVINNEISFLLNKSLNFNF